MVEYSYCTSNLSMSPPARAVAPYSIQPTPPKTTRTGAQLNHNTTNTPVSTLSQVLGGVGAAGTEVGQSTRAGRDSNGSTGRLNLCAQADGSEIDRYSSPPPPPSSRSSPCLSSHPPTSPTAGTQARRRRGRRRCRRRAGSAEEQTVAASSSSSSFRCGGVAAVSTSGKIVTDPFAVPVVRSRKS